MATAVRVVPTAMSGLFSALMIGLAERSAKMSVVMATGTPPS